MALFIGMAGVWRQPSCSASHASSKGLPPQATWASLHRRNKMNRIHRLIDSLLAVSLGASLLAAVVTALPAPALAAEGVTGNGDTAQGTRNVSDFEAVRTDGLDIRLRQGAAQAVSVKADRNLLALIETTVEDSAQGKTLVVRFKPGLYIKWGGKAAVTVTATKLTALQVRGSGDVQAEGLKQPRLAVSIDGSGDVMLKDIAIDDLSLAVKGSGDILAQGTAPRLAISIAGSGDVKTRDLKADEVTVKIAGSGDADVQAERNLTVAIAGSGDVVYTGNAVLKKSIAGSGSVSKR
jgi:hypothetical protein